MASLSALGKESQHKYLIVQRMEIADLAQVLSHQINRVYETTSHVIHFVGGGVFSCVYDDHGKMVEMDSRGLRQSSSPDGVITVYGSGKKGGFGVV
ncbi:hypothetical protein ACFDR9_004792 [Janthinobacterium sp. CG_23.3]|uniref:hypothetical protein n=1 Tax=Janthinobacterium sp. CG_23.3 TaxID=3349634 RepID=UPI0038D41263